MYNTGKEFKELTGDAYMKIARETTPEEHLQILRDCLEHNRNYRAMALKYQCSVRHWVMKYEKMGSTELEDGGLAPSQTEPRKMKCEIKSQSWNDGTGTYRCKMTY